MAERPEPRDLRDRALEDFARVANWAASGRSRVDDQVHRLDAGRRANLAQECRFMAGFLSGLALRVQALPAADERSGPPA